MNRPSPLTDLPSQILMVHRAGDFVTTSGANVGDPVMEADGLVLDDIFQLAPNTDTCRLAMVSDGARFFVGLGSDAGAFGQPLVLDCLATFMGPSGTIVEALILVALDNGNVDDVFLLPLAPLMAQTPYQLVGIVRDDLPKRLAQVACASFTRGTHITMSDGRQVPIEDLNRGDRVLTRDGGAQKIAWVGASTVRATGDLAPILIQKGALNNDRDLTLSPNHRLFVYQREDHLGLGRAEVFVRASQLVNGQSVIRMDGGFVDYFQLLFEHHQIVYAEGIAAESLLLDGQTDHALPEDVAKALAARARHRPAHPGADLPEAALDDTIVDRLRRASTR